MGTAYRHTGRADWCAADLGWPCRTAAPRQEISDNHEYGGSSLDLVEHLVVPQSTRQLAQSFRVARGLPEVSLVGDGTRGG